MEWILIFLFGFVFAALVGWGTRHLLWTLIAFVFGVILAWFFLPFFFSLIVWLVNNRPTMPPITPPPGVSTPIAGPTQTPGQPGNPGTPPPGGGTGGLCGNPMVSCEADGRIHMPGGNPPDGYTASFNIPNGYPAGNCFNGVNAQLMKDGNRIAGGGNAQRITLSPGQYTVVGGKGNGGFEIKHC